MTRPGRPGKPVRVNAVSREGEAIIADVVTPSGVRVAHRFPVDTLEWRAAEYGLDPVVDADTLVDIVITEPHMDSPVDPALALHTAPTVAAAREHHLSRVLPVEYADGVREEIRAHSVMAPEALDIKREYVAAARASTARERPEPTDHTDRVERLRAMLTGPARKRDAPDA